MAFETVTATQVFHITENTNDWRMRNVMLQSAITDGSPVVRIYVDQPGINLTNWLLDDVVIAGCGTEGNGIEIVCARPDSWIYRGCLRDVEVYGCGGAGLLVSGSVFESSAFNLQCHDNHGSGAVFQHEGGGQASAWSLFGANLRKNEKWGLELLNGCIDVRPFGGYFCENVTGGINADQGITSAFGVGFENNGRGVRFQNFGALYGCNFSTDGRQTPAIGGTLGNGTLMLVNTGNWDYGSQQSVLLAVDGSGQVVAVDKTGLWVKAVP